MNKQFLTPEPKHRNYRIIYVKEVNGVWMKARLPQDSMRPMPTEFPIRVAAPTIWDFCKAAVVAGFTVVTIYHVRNPDFAST